MMRPIVPLLLPLALLAGTAAQGATARSADRWFVDKVGQGGLFEIAAGKLATKKGTTSHVRDFGAMEVHDHMLVGDRLKTVAAEEGLAVPTTLSGKFATKLRTLSGLSGHAFDQAYLREMTALHEVDGAAFLKDAKGGGTPAIRRFGAETHAIVVRHLGALHAAASPAR